MPTRGDNSCGKRCSNVCLEWEFGEFLSYFPQAASCTEELASIVGQLWEEDRQNTPASHCHATEEVQEKYALR